MLLLIQKCPIWGEGGRWNRTGVGSGLVVERGFCKYLPSPTSTLPTSGSTINKWHQAMFLFSITCPLCLSSFWLGLIPVNGRPWETWLDLRKWGRQRTLVWRIDIARCPSALTPREYSWESASWWDESISFRIFQPSSLWKNVYFVLWLSSFPVCVFFRGLGHRDTPLYKKQTAPTSTPNSWSAPPMSIGAMSTMGRREVFCVLYSKTVLPHRPVCFCGRREEKKSLSTQALNGLDPCLCCILCGGAFLNRISSFKHDTVLMAGS